MIACWRYAEQYGEQLWCAADTRVSNENITVSESGAKIFLILVTFRATGADVSDTRNFTLGFAFCGNALLGHNAHAIASTCTQMMHSQNLEAVPSVKGIATIYAKVAEYVTKDLNSRRNNEFQGFQSVVFGFCPVEKRLKWFLLTPQFLATTFSTDIREHSPGPGDILAIGSDAQEFDRQLDIKNRSEPSNIRCVPSGHRGWKSSNRRRGPASCCS